MLHINVFLRGGGPGFKSPRAHHSPETCFMRDYVGEFAVGAVVKEFA